MTRQRLRVKAWAAFALALAFPATPVAGEVCKYVDAGGNLHYSTLAPEPGWTRLACADENDIEPAPGYPQDPHKAPVGGKDGLVGYRCRLAPGAGEMACIDKGQVAIEGDTRRAELFAGRPNRVRATGTDLVVDCATGVVTVRRRDGGQATAHPAAPMDVARALGREMCITTTPRGYQR